MTKISVLSIGVLTLTSIFSCKALIAHKFKFNRKFDFKNREEYFNYLEAEKKFDISHMLYPDSSSVQKFIKYLSDNKLTVYYGTLLNDSVELKKSPELQDNLSCMGRILTEITNAGNSFTDSLYIRSQFKDFSFRFINSQKKFEFYKTGETLKIFLLYSYMYGTYFDPFLKEMNKFASQNTGKATVYIVNLDYIYHFE